MARNRSIAVVLKAEISDFQNKMGQASRSLSDFEREQQKMGGAADTTLGRLAQSAKINEDAWTRVGIGVAAAGGAITGVLTSLVSTGIEYNALRQTATKAMEGVTGSTEAAARQMDRLNTYGESSWLMRDVLIRAQQQMTGFGIETNKVIPYMDALSEAVAGTTGSQQNFEELAQVMGRIESQGKLTARELEIFGHRGIDAAEMIAIGMGTTASAIRDEITAGTLDATEALDAMAVGMLETYEGSSDRMRDTWEGAFNNLKAAWRDLGAELASPLVDPEGGGLLVGFVNGLADGLNRLRDLPGPVLTAVGAVTGLVGAAATLGGLGMVALPQIAKFQESLQTLSATHPNLTKTAGALSKVTGAATIAAGAIVAVNIAGAGLERWTSSGHKGPNELAAALDNLVESGQGVDTLFEDVGNSLGQNLVRQLVGPALSGVVDFTVNLNDLEGSLQKLSTPNWFDSLTRGWMDFLGLWSSTEQGQMEQRFEEIGAHLSTLAQTDLTAVTAQFSALLDEFGGTEEAGRALLEMMPQFRDELIGLATDAGLATDDATLLKIATGELEISTDGATDAIRSNVDALRDQHSAMRDATNAILDASDSEIRYRDTVDRATEAIKENGAGLDLKTEKGRDNQSALNDLVRAGQDHIEMMLEEGASLRDVANFASELRGQYVGMAQDAGYSADEARNLANDLNLVPGKYVAEIIANTSQATGPLSTVLGMLSRIVSKRISVGVSSLLGGGAYEGGFIPKRVPGLKAGGKVPGARAGYDNVMWPLHSGGQVLGQPLEGGEFVVRSSQANRPDYAPVLHSMNQGTYQPAGGAGISRADMYAFARIVAGETAAAAGAAVREGAAVGVGGVGVSGGLVARMGDF